MATADLSNTQITDTPSHKFLTPAFVIYSITLMSSTHSDCFCISWEAETLCCKLLPFQVESRTDDWGFFSGLGKTKCASVYLVDKIRATISPYRPNTSAKIRMRIMPTNSLGCCAVPRTPASPTMPIAYPAASPLKPTLKPAPRWTKLLQRWKRSDQVTPKIFSVCAWFLTSSTPASTVHKYFLVSEFIQTL